MRPEDGSPQPVPAGATGLPGRARVGSAEERIRAAQDLHHHDRGLIVATRRNGHPTPHMLAAQRHRIRSAERLAADAQGCPPIGPPQTRAVDLPAQLAQSRALLRALEALTATRAAQLRARSSSIVGAVHADRTGSIGDVLSLALLAPAEVSDEGYRELLEWLRDSLRSPGPIQAGQLSRREVRDALRSLVPSTWSFWDAQ